MTVTAVIGAQFGDEAKGKITDVLSERAKYVVRTGGGPNAGHTIKLGDTSLVLHQLSVGVLRRGVTGISGPGMVIDPFQLEVEIADVQSKHALHGTLVLSDKAHVILPHHRSEDAWEEGLRAKGYGVENGTTGRGIGPAYEDRSGRWGLRLADLDRPELLRRRLDVLLSTKTLPPGLPSVDELTAQLLEVGERLAPHIQSTEPILWDALQRGDSIILEGAQSALLDLDFGTYPYVTSSHPTAAGALVGSGIPPQELNEVIGVTKAYATRVGAGPFPTEDTGAMGEALREAGGERGATTGRPRRCGWLDLVLLRYATRLNGFTSLAVTKVDVLGGMDSIPVAAEYEGPGGARMSTPPTVAEDYDALHPVYEHIPGWPEFTPRLKERIRRDGVHALPSELKRFLAHLTEATGVPVEWVSYGARRDETLFLGRGKTASPVSRWSA
ncbi:MAG: adenylosuccinate synthase [Thermoplasmata archaeon]|nr:adenylosuccinate synthase [Thermoplasmata archaeon]